MRKSGWAVALLLLVSCGGDEDYRVELPSFGKTEKVEEAGAVSVEEIVRLLNDTRSDDSTVTVAQLVDPFYSSPRPVAPPPVRRASTSPPPPPPPLPRVEGIVQAGGGAAACIGGKLYRVGDRVEGWVVRSIDGSGIQIGSAERSVVVKVGEPLPREGSFR